MPSVSGYSSTANSIQWIIEGLMYPAYQYTNFQIELWRGSTHVETLNWTSNSSQTYTMNSFFNLSANTTYRAKAWTRYSGGPSTFIGESSYSTESVYIPPTPVAGYPTWVDARADQYSSGWIDVTWGSGSNADYYVVSIPSIGYSSGARYSNSASIGGLGEGYSYTVYVTSYNSRGEGGYNFNTVTTKNFTPTTPGSISWVTPTPSTVTIGKVTLDWGSASYATGYRAEIWTTGGTNVRSEGTSYTNIVFTGLDQHTQYYAKVYAQNSYVNGPANNYNYFTTHDFRPPIPGLISTVSLIPSTSTSGRMTVGWSASSNATGYKVELYNTSGNLAVPQQNLGSSAREYAFSGLPEWTQYYAKVFGYNERGNATQGTNSITARTTDLTPPSISFSGMTGLGGLQLSWTSSDGGSGIRSSDRNRLYVGTRNGSASTLSGSGWTNNNSNTWTSDANGYGLIANSYYWVGVRVYDNSNNESVLLSREIQYKITRPSEWSWFTSKTQGATMNLTASEWNSFTSRISLFRTYRGITTDYPFTNAVKGSTMTASIMNEAILAMNIMSPSSSTSQVSSNGAVTAKFFDDLRRSLNSVT